MASLPSTFTPANPYALALTAIDSLAVCRAVGTLMAQWLFWQMNTTGGLNTPAKFIATWKSPSLVAPSPMYAATTVRSPLMRAAMAQRGEDPVALLKRDGRGERGRFLPGARAVEADAALPLQRHRALIHRAQAHHLAI